MRVLLCYMSGFLCVSPRDLSQSYGDPEPDLIQLVMLMLESQAKVCHCRAALPLTNALFKAGKSVRTITS